MTHARQPGRAVLTFIGTALGLVAMGLVGWYVYVEYRRNYWDDKVREMCAKDGGVHVTQQTLITASQYGTLVGRVGGHSAFSPRGPAKARGDVLYSELHVERLRNGSPEVVRLVTIIKRTATDTPVGTTIAYTRIGGDFPTIISHPSSFSCPSDLEMLAAHEKLFLVQGD